MKPDQESDLPLLSIGDVQLSNQHPAPQLPRGTYDVGDGYLNDDGDVCDYSTGEIRRHATHQEEVWAKLKCRRG